ncbi:phosphoheptose isomerase [Candidatus Kaiserbacteria bacterium RIFCSPHIGHO2_02_FULL_49_16]|uniref:Phosphoheptose isomerase n=1 Tax=Candidatus Kaiserbacteria bacterium RIFCSPHIGHO2_02_FULL_49_16 TaxID=1798490 RepID=A0A1F6DD00_9BACT|nr:MAG: phosphoheptose isomerase [Candidatus Kaiserbacteria bacterium RIFCSPHIGHO2_02_FULL_49_16]
MNNPSDTIRDRIEAHIKTARGLGEQSASIASVAECFVSAIRNGGKILLCGNGGSAADAQHVAAELVGRFARERAAWPAIALTANSSIVTAIGNDYGYEHIFARQVAALGKKGDVVVGISTSGNSPNVLEAMREARTRGCMTIGMTGKNGKALRELTDISVSVSSDETPRIQEAHILAWHIVCELVENDLASPAI